MTTSGITDVKNFITAGQLSTPKKHGTSQSWRTDTALITFATDSFLHIVYLKINIFCNNSWSLGKYRMTLTFKVYFDPFQTSHSMCKHGRTSSRSDPNTKWGQKVRKSHTSVRSVPKILKIPIYIFKTPPAYKGEDWFAKSTRDSFSQLQNWQTWKSKFSHSRTCTLNIHLNLNM